MPGVFALLTGISGIFTAFSVSEKSFIPFLIFLFFGLLFISLQREKSLKVIGILIFLLIFFNAFFGFSMLNKPQIPERFNEKEITLTAKTSDFSKQTIRPNSFHISNIEIRGEKFSGNAKVYCGIKSSPPPYSLVKIKGKIRFYPQNGTLNRINGTSYVVYAESIEVLKENRIMKEFSKLRERIAYNTLLSMKSSEAMLLLSSVSGIAAMNWASKAPFQQTGTAHIFAVSGLHIGILGESTERVFSFAGESAGIISIIMLFIFVLLVGFRASALRAFLMFVISETARISGKEQIPLSTLSFVALILILINPLIIFSVSFQLSFAAIFGIIILAPKLYVLMPRKVIFKMFSQVIAVQLTLYPLMAYYFHTFSPISFLANLFVIPLMYIALPIGIIQILFSSINLHLAKIFAPVSNFMFGLLAKIVVLSSHIPFSSLNIRFNIWLLLVYLFALLIFLLFLSKEKKFGLIGTIIIIGALLLPFVVPAQFSIVPLKLKGEDGFLIRDGKIAIYITSPTILENEETDQYPIKKTLAQNGVNKISLLICNAPITKGESAALRILPQKYKIPDIIIPLPKTDLSESFVRLNKNFSKIHYVNEESKISFNGIDISLIKCGSKYAVLLNRKGMTYLLAGRECKLTGNFPYANFVFVPEGADIKNVRFGKLCSY